MESDEGTEPEDVTRMTAAATSSNSVATSEHASQDDSLLTQDDTEAAAVAVMEHSAVNGSNEDDQIALVAAVDEMLPLDDIDDPPDPDAEEFRRRFYEAVSRRMAQPPGVPAAPPEYEEFDEDDNADLLDEVGDDGMSDDQSSGPSTSHEEEGMDEESNDARTAVEPFDPQLPTRHAYLGEAMESISGRTIFEGGSVIEIPLVLLEFHLVPGQTLPLTIYNPTTQTALMSCVPGNRHFGIIHAGLNDVNLRGPLPYGALGTTAEVYEYNEERPQVEPRGRLNRLDLPLPPSVNIKAKGRHRFNVVCTFRQADGHLMAKVKVRPEISLPKVWRNWMSSNHRYMFPLVLSEEGGSTDKLKEDPSGSVLVSSSKRQSFFSPKRSENDLSILRRVSEGFVCRPKDRRAYRYYAASTPWPYFVYEQFDEKILAEKILHRLNSDLSALVSSSHVPSDPAELSFWLAQNLTINDTQRLQILRMDTPAERLRFAQKLLDRVSKTIKCGLCGDHVADCADIFSMSVEGPQGTYVNPHGYVHELITVTKINGVVYKGLPSTESSWFPGYSWRIMECRVCREHVGWKFEAVDKLLPKKFWGLARRSVNFKYNFGPDDESGVGTSV